MNTKELIASGELELYVAGLLSEERNQQLSEIIKTNQEVAMEVASIEQMIMRLSEEATYQNGQDFTKVLKKIISQKIKDNNGQNGEQFNKQSRSKVYSLIPYIGWAAAATMLIFVFFQYQNTIQIKEDLISNIQQKEQLEFQIKEQVQDATLKSELLATVASINTTKINLTGQEISPNSNVSVFWNTEKGKIVVDAANLPIPPENMVYQIWSLKLNPLEPKSLGLLESFNNNNTLFVFENPNNSEAFGITLEPAGGSQSPTLERLYVLGTLPS